MGSGFEAVAIVAVFNVLAIIAIVLLQGARDLNRDQRFVQFPI